MTDDRAEGRRSGAEARPAELGYRMPAEWAPHRGTWLSWPHRESSWPGRFDQIPQAFAEIVRHLVPREEVHLNVNGPEMEASARGVLERAGIPTDRVFFYHHPTNDAWCRDHGPIFLSRGETEQLIVDWGYNAWGGKYPPFEDDDRIPSLIGERFGIPVVHPGMVLEGGSIEVNGRGTLLTTESCLLNPNRNPELTKAEIERYLSDYLGVTNILWLGDGIEGGIGKVTISNRLPSWSVMSRSRSRFSLSGRWLGSARSSSRTVTRVRSFTNRVRSSTCPSVSSPSIPSPSQRMLVTPR
jgi:agmatine/peptidylarginine deiminase